MVCGLIQYLHRKPNRNKETSRNVQIQGGEPEWGPLVPLQAHVSGEASRVPKQEVKQKCSNFNYKILLKLPALSPITNIFQQLRSALYQLLRKVETQIWGPKGDVGFGNFISVGNSSRAALLVEVVRDSRNPDHPPVGQYRSRERPDRSKEVK